MFKIFLYFFLLSAYLYSQNILNNTYFVESEKIYLSDLFSDVKKDKLLYTVDQYKHSKRVKSKELISLLKELGINDIKASSRYIKFQIKSPIDTSPIKEFILEYYKQRYPTMKISSIKLSTRGYIDSIPKEYFIQIGDRNFLQNSGIVNIKSNDGRKIFFNYFIDAKIKILLAKKRIKRQTKLSKSNTYFKTIRFDRFKATPLVELEKNKFQSSRDIRENNIITINNIQRLDLVHRNTQVSVSLYNNGIYITFTAKALQSGALGDIITIQKTNLTRLKATVIGNRRVQIK